MAPDLLQWGDDLISEPADFTNDLFDDQLNGVSESDDVWARTTPKDKFTSSIVADKSYFYDFKIIPPTLQVSVISNNQPKSYKFTIQMIIHNVKALAYIRKMHFYRHFMAVNSMEIYTKNMILNVKIMFQISTRFWLK